METQSKKKRVAWNKGIKRTEEEKQKQRQTVFERYGVYNVSQIKEVKEKIKASHETEEWKESVKQTKLRRYNNPNYNNMEKNLKTKQERYGTPKYNNMDKNIQTKRRNRTFCTSSIEEKLYKYLIGKYGEEDVCRQYKESRYPFACDFYVKSKDLFIELNIHPAHNFCPFNPEDISCLEKLQYFEERAKTSEYYKQIIKTWTISDPLKIKTASDNKLNYIMFYKTKDVIQAMDDCFI